MALTGFSNSYLSAEMRTISLPTAAVRVTHSWSKRVQIDNEQTFALYALGIAAPDANIGNVNVQAVVEDIGEGNVLASNNVSVLRGEPIAEVDAPATVELRVENNSDDAGTINLNAFADYRIIP